MIMENSDDKKEKPFVYDPRITGIENIHRILRDAGVPLELLDNVEVTAVLPSNYPEFRGFAEKNGNSALKVNYFGELAKLTGLKQDVHFYNRTLPIPDIWEGKVMYILDSETKNTNMGVYIKNRWLQDGFPFVGENLTFDVKGKEDVLDYGRNIVEVKASPRSYGLVGTAEQLVQYFVDLDDKLAKNIMVVNPFIPASSVKRLKRNGYIEVFLTAESTIKETERKILGLFLSETYGLIRGKAVLNEINREAIDLVRLEDFKESLEDPKSEEERIEKRALATYHSAQLYTLSETQFEDDSSNVVGNFRLMIAKGLLGRLVRGSGRYPVDEEQAYRFRQERVRTFVLTGDEENDVKFNITLEKKYQSNQEVTDAVKRLLAQYFGEFKNNVKVDNGEVQGDHMVFTIVPSEKISDYVAGEIKAFVNFKVEAPKETPKENPDDAKITVKRNLNGFSKVSIS